MVNRIMRALRLDKIAVVDRPCQEGATMTIMKRAAEMADDSAFLAISKRKYTAEQRREYAASGIAMKDGSYPIPDKDALEDAIHAIGRGKGSHAAIRQHIVRRAKALGATDSLPDDWKVSKIAKAIRSDIAKAGFSVPCDTDDGAQSFDDLVHESIPQQFFDDFYSATSALQTSIRSILQDETVSDKGAMITQSLQQFADYVEECVPGGVGKSLAAGFAALAGGAGPTLKGEHMSDALKKALGLSATATEAEITKAAENLAEDKKKLEDEKAKTEKRADAIAKMSEKHKEFMNHPKAKLPSGGKEAFADMEPGERDKHMEAHPLSDNDEDDTEKALKKGLAFRASDGTVFHKRDFGTEAAYNFAKSQAETIRKQAEDIAKAKEREDAASFEKRATDLGFEAAFGATLRKAYSGDSAAQAEVEKKMQALKKQADEGGLFASFGKGSAKAGSAESELLAKAADIKKSDPKLSDQQAYAKAYKDPANADIRKRMKTEANA